MEATAACVPYEFEQADTHHDPTEQAAQEFEDDLHNTEMKINNSISVFEKAAQEINVDTDMLEKKMRRYPAMIRQIRALRDYSIPTMVAIGPYHHARLQLMAAEKLKHVAAYHFIGESNHLLEEVYYAVVLAADDVRRLYDKDVMAGIDYDDFRHMMFFDACFLVQCMIFFTHNDGRSAEIDPSLGRYLASYSDEIFHDIMLLENQIPWRVVEAVMVFRPVRLEDVIISLNGCLQDRMAPAYENHVVLDGSYKPPHLLGLLRYYIVGRRRSNGNLMKPLVETRTISFSASAIELAEVGIKLTCNNKTELSLAPLCLNDMSANCLVNMAALELCTTLNFTVAEDEASAVCSYLILFALLVDKEEDVQELRANLLLRGGGRGELTNSEVLDFFTSLRGLRLGSCYVWIMEDIKNYKAKRQLRTTVHAFVYKNIKTIVIAISVIATLVAIAVSERVYNKGL
jgi:hypothetical protein